MANFDLGLLDNIIQADQCDVDLEALEYLFDGEFDDVFGDLNVSTVPDEALREMDNALKLNESTEADTLCTPNASANKRFKSVSDTELRELQENKQSTSTKMNTKWGIRVFQDWSVEKTGQNVDFTTIADADLCDMLGKFYAEASPQQTKKRTKEMNENQAREYHKNSMKSIRSGINRHIRDIGRDIDIVRDKSFRRANDLLDGKLKKNLREGLSRPTQHKEIISKTDLEKIATYLRSGINQLNPDPVILRFKVWYDLSLHFVTRGLEFHEQLNRSSFVFLKDENGLEYATLSHETREKNWQGGLDGKNNPTDKRMYATENEDCPVRALKCLISKTNPNATRLFNHCMKDALISPETCGMLYTSKPVKHYQFTRFMADICKNAKCSKIYTAHCLRATSIQAMSDAGFELRHIMYMSGHRNESSVRSYNRECSLSQKRAISHTLSDISTGNTSANAMIPLPNRQFSSAPTFMSSNLMSSGFISNSTFSNCVFQFAK